MFLMSEAPLYNSSTCTERSLPLLGGGARLSHLTYKGFSLLYIHASVTLRHAPRARSRDSAASVGSPSEGLSLWVG